MLGQTIKHLAAFAVIVVAAAAFVAPAAADPITVGQFVQELARVKKLAATDPQTAADALAGVGIRLPADLDLAKTLTEGDVAAISRASGLNVKATDETAEFDGRQLEEFLAVFSNQLGDGGLTLRATGDCATDEYGACLMPGADCIASGKAGFCQPGPSSCNCNTGTAKGKRKQVVTADEPE